MSKSKFVATIYYEIEADDEYRASLRDEREAVRPELLEQSMAFRDTKVTKVLIKERK